MLIKKNDLLDSRQYRSHSDQTTMQHSFEIHYIGIIFPQFHVNEDLNMFVYGNDSAILFPPAQKSIELINARIESHFAHTLS